MIPTAEAVADHMAKLLAWSSQRRNAELCAVQQRFASELGFALARAEHHDEGQMI